MKTISFGKRKRQEDTGLKVEIWASSPPKGWYFGRKEVSHGCCFGTGRPSSGVLAWAWFCWFDLSSVVRTSRRPGKVRFFEEYFKMLFIEWKYILILNMFRICSTSLYNQHDHRTSSIIISSEGKFLVHLTTSRSLTCWPIPDHYLMLAVPLVEWN